MGVRFPLDARTCGLTGKATRFRISGMGVRIPPGLRKPLAPDWTGTGLLLRAERVRVLRAARSDR